MELGQGHIDPSGCLLALIFQGRKLKGLAFDRGRGNPKLLSGLIDSRLHFDQAGRSR